MRFVSHYLKSKTKMAQKNSAINTMKEKIADLESSVMYLTDQNICLIKSMEKNNQICMDLQEKVMQLQGKFTKLNKNVMHYVL